MGWFGTTPVEDARFGTLTRTSGRWIGSILLPPHGTVELRLAGGRKAPDRDSLAIAEHLAAHYQALHGAVAAALFEHFEPYSDAALEGDSELDPEVVAQLQTPDDVWIAVRGAVADVDAGRRDYPVEVRLEVAWDSDHTLGVRIKDGVLVELCGSTEP